MNPLPTGAVTFLFTDIEKSTRMWSDHADQMAPALERHDSMMGEAIESGGGHVFETVGDAFHAAFASPTDALATAIEAQRSLQAEDWHEAVPIRVRMALHTGEADLRDGDYHGTTLNRCARVLGLGHGGQILVSHASEELLRECLPAGVSLRDMGEHRLRDLALPERVHQVDVEGLPQTFPALVSLDAHAHNLPRQLTSLVGRDAEIADLLDLLERERLVTLTGVGGTGKTRLALQVAAESVGEFAGGVWYTELAPVTDPARIPATIAQALNLREETGRPILDTLTDHLGGADVLLLLDNCEHMLEGCARFAETLLQSTSTVRILATSRETLGVPGEITRPVPSLSVPAAYDHGSGADDHAVVEAVRSCDATKLFVERAESAQPLFEVTPDNAWAVVEICRRLDGIPLAIELAAARVKLLHVAQVAERLDDRFRLLTGGSRTALPRQQTLQNAIDWSYDLLDDAEKRLFARLAVFISSWTLEAAEAMYVEDEADPYEVLETMSRLVDKSLVDLHGAGSPQRYRYLETVRQYARDKLARSDENADVRGRHLAYYLGFAEEQTEDLLGPDQVERLDRLESERANLSAALEWAVDGGPDQESSERLVIALWRLWTVHCHYSDAIEWAGRVERMGAGRPPTTHRAMVLYVAAWTHLLQGDLEVAQSMYEDALETFLERGDKVRESWVYNDLAFVHANGGDCAKAAELLEKSASLKLELGETLDGAMSLCNLGELAWRDGDYDRAVDYNARSLALLESLGDECDQRSYSILYHNMGEVARCRGDLTASGPLYRDGLRLSLEIGEKLQVAAAIAGIGGVAAAEKRPVRGARLLAAAEAMREPFGMPMDDVNQREQDRMVADARSQLDEATWNRACSEGLAMTEEEVVEYALGDDD